MTTLNRRKFLKISVVGITGSVFFLIVARKLRPYFPLSLKSYVAHCFKDFSNPNIERFGAAYLRYVPAEDDREGLALTAAIFGDPSLHWTHSFQTLSAFVDRKIRQDFATGNVLKMQNWLFSKTEMQIYALAYIFRRQN